MIYSLTCGCNSLRHHAFLNVKDHIPNCYPNKLILSNKQDASDSNKKSIYCHWWWVVSCRDPLTPRCLEFEKTICTWFMFPGLACQGGKARRIITFIFASCKYISLFFLTLSSRTLNWMKERFKSILVYVPYWWQTRYKSFLGSKKPL